MRLNHAFDTHLEKAFKKAPEFVQIGFLRWAFSVFAFLYALFAITDITYFPELWRWIFVIRFAIVIPTLLITIGLTYTKFFARHLQGLVMMNVIIGGFGITIMLILNPENIIYYAGMLLVLFSGYFLVNLRFFPALSSGWTVVGLYVLGFMVYYGETSEPFLFGLLFFVAANILGMIGAYNMEDMNRKNFLKNKEIDAYIDELALQNKEISGHLAELGEFIRTNQNLVIENEEKDRWTKELRDSQMLLEASLESFVDTIILSIDRNYTYYYFNDTHRKAMKTAYHADVEIGMNMLDAITSEKDRAHAKKNYDLAMKGNSHSTIEKFGDANVRYYESFYNPLYDSEGKIVGATTFARDITEKVLAEMKLKDSEERYRLLYQSMNQGLALHEIICDESGKPVDYRFISVNESFERLTGLKKEKLIGKRVRKALPNTEDHWIERYGQVALSGEPMQFEDYSQELDKVFYVSAYAPKKGYFATIIEDVTEHKKMEKIISDNEMRFQQLAEQSRTIIWEINPEGLYTYISNAVEEVLGYSQEEVTGKMYFYDLFPEPDREFYKTMAFENMKLKVISKDVQNPLQTKSGETIWVTSHVIPIMDESGNIIAHKGSDMDITESKHKQEEIEYISYHDFLTEIPNRRYFSEKLAEIDNYKQYPLGLMIMDFNGLKVINDAFGHSTGNKALKHVAKALLSIKRKDDVVARIGGDEFAMILPNTDEGTIEDIKTSIQLKLAKDTIENIEYSMAIGYAVKHRETQAIRKILARAENDMYRKKVIEGRSVRNRSIMGILKTLTDKYKEEKVHSERVAHYCKAIGIAMRLSEEEIKELELAGMLHDIGKISIPDRILDKPGTLTEKEWVIMREHPLSGYQILRAADEYSDLAVYAMTHHERIDGKGYPNGLKDKEIPLFSKIISVADAYEAMTGNRLYRKAIGVEAAIKELKKYSGTQFDANVVNVFIEKVIRQESM